MFLFAWTVLLCACACSNGMAVGENKMVASALTYRTYSNGGSYLFDPTPSNWTDSSKVCRMYDGHLAFPKTQDEADVLWSILADYNVNQVHAGFHDQYKEGEYFTVKGRPMNETFFSQWSSGAPIGGSTNNCGGLRPDGLVDVACGDKYTSICEKNLSSGGGGFKDYVLVEGHGYFKHVPQRVEWVDAMSFCLKEGSHLWIVNSAQERDEIFQMFSLHPTEGIWVGVHQRHANHYFVTVFDDSLESTGFMEWNQYEPNGSNIDFPYVHVNMMGLTTFKSPRMFVCEYNPTSGVV